MLRVAESEGNSRACGLWVSLSRKREEECYASAVMRHEYISVQVKREMS